MKKVEATPAEPKYKNDRGEVIEHRKETVVDYLGLKIGMIEELLDMYCTAASSFNGYDNPTILHYIGEFLFKDLEKDLVNICNRIEDQVGAIRIDTAARQPGYNGGELLGISLEPILSKKKTKPGSV